MKVLLAAGAPHSSHQEVLELFRGLGLVDPLGSRYEGQSPQTLQGLILGGHEIDLAKPAPLQAVKPGRLWSEMAVDLFMANINQPIWGWADHQTGLLLDFWAEFDPQVRFVLCYEAPNVYLANALEAEPEPDMSKVERALGEWSRWNSFLLNQFQRHRDRCLLVNSQAVLRDPQQLLDAVGKAWQWPVENVHYPVDVTAVEVMAHYVARSFVPADHVSWAQAGKLETEAHVPGIKQSGPLAGLEAAWSDWVQMRERLGEAVRIVPIEADRNRLDKELAALRQTWEVASEENERNALQLAAFGAANEELQAQVRQIQSKAASAEVEQLSQQISKLASRIEAESRDNVRAAELVLENDHLMVALHQIQEELESQVQQTTEFDLRQPLNGEALAGVADSFAAKFWGIHPPQELALDMRRDIDGENWYGPEPDGRWAGPELLSRIKLPPLAPGAYALELSLADAIAPDIVYGLQIEAFGTDVPFEFSHAATRESFPLVCRAQIDVPPDAGSEPWSLGFKFPRTVSPAENGSDDQRQLAIRLSSLQLRRAVEPVVAPDVV